MEHVFILYDARRGGDRGTGCVATLSVCRSMLPTNGNLAYILEQAVRLGGHHNMPPPRDLDFWLFDLEVGVGVACDLYPCAKFRLPRPFGFRVRADVRDIRQTDRRRRSPLNAPAPPPTGRGHNNWVTAIFSTTSSTWSTRGPFATAELLVKLLNEQLHFGLRFLEFMHENYK